MIFESVFTTEEHLNIYQMLIKYFCAYNFLRTHRDIKGVCSGPKFLAFQGSLEFKTTKKDRNVIH